MRFSYFGLPIFKKLAATVRIRSITMPEKV